MKEFREFGGTFLFTNWRKLDEEDRIRNFEHLDLFSEV